MQSKSILLALVLVNIVAITFTTPVCPIGIVQSKIGEWNDENGCYSVWEVTLTNMATQNIKDVTVIGESNLNLRNSGDLWALEQVYTNKFHLPSYVWEYGIEPGKTYKFGYINKGSNSAMFTFADITFKH
ncbi:cellulose-binding domain-containing protein [Tieghemostelium lacteum]|uniref:Cellulose-binding domain-containing protein n=1 Tax=Tieghemostelium lacteum TaxID=361077 RepID=A0A151ZJ02_TIELA|nr:cellulose-binding domain-containing protein [Tieghemostelium lacteum]|eukprot:KYQ93885.1 cellulose-binding domain-containing protein [Tieghemostelium lacteum]